MWASTGDARFKERADYLVRELKIVQDKQGDGYLSALEEGRDAFTRLARGEIESGSFDLNGLWSPWYTLHKMFGGLRDAYRYTGNRTALEMEVAFAEWAGRVLADLDESQLEHMMNTEIGGMNEIMVDLYEDTGDERWLELSRKFEHDDFVVPLKEHRDNLAGKHGNTTVPKLIGSADRFVATGDPSDLMAAGFYWDTVVSRHSFATGGHGKDEYFGPAGQIGSRVDGRTAETCNVYNMLKLTRRLFAISPEVRFADFHERVLFNHILGSMDPEDGRTCYMVPVGRGVQHEYQDMFESFTCCVGTGMESHALHGDGIYFEEVGRLFVNLYVPSTVEWSQPEALLTVDTDFPLGESATIRIRMREPRTLTLSLRRPYWAGAGFDVRVNGDPVPLPEPAARDWRDSRSQYQDAPTGGSSFLDITRTWRDGDTIEVRLPKSLWIEPTPDNPGRVAILWGPLVLSGDLGPERRRSESEEHEDVAPPPPVPVLVAADRPVNSWLKPDRNEPGRFRT
ncbi:MAG: beta-L-arabinofuranosidase domain-containing protein, partial [Woeseiaceae bacterium]